jgi:glycosyltransferase involved in cell wall biosynthesis
MKYPYVIFYRNNKYNYVDKFFIQNARHLECTIFIAESLQHIKNLHNCNYHLLITFGETIDILPDISNLISNIISKNMLVRHTHIADIHYFTKRDIHQFNKFINSFYIQICSLERNKIRPTFSLFTPSYNSYHKILRVYNSLLKQTLIDWEWIIIDDSPDDDNFKFLRDNFSNEPRIRFYRRSCNNGSIGNVKNETIGLCRGKYVLEMDHDDELMPYVLQESADLFKKYNNIGFIYYDCACVYENGNNQWYGDFICKGYGGYYSQKIDDKWRLVYITPNINNITLSHLVCCPNHPRIWRKDKLIEMGSYCEYLPICDDYEIILRTSVSTEIAKIHKLGYIQYMNESNNNFSLIRNSEINRIGPEYISPIYFEKFQIDQHMEDKNAYEDVKYKEEHSKIWERNSMSYKHKYCNLIFNNDHDVQYCIIGFDSLLFYLDKIKELYNNPRNDFIVLENKCTTEYLQNRLDRYDLGRMKCYSLVDTSVEQLIQYFKLLYLSTTEYVIINSDINKPLFNTNFGNRYDIINKLTKPSDIYLEIGVEYGECFNKVHFSDKTGIDPDPKFSPLEGQLFISTSDQFFETKGERTFDVIFIDGMHQAEYLLRDINNSIRFLSDDGFIFIDDILPFNYNEQLKIPINHYYEKGILKYAENWTGDVWKVIYYLLVKHKDKLSLCQYYYNIHFRGVLVIKIKEKFQLNEDDIHIINDYDYFTDYSQYVKLLEAIGI